MLRLKSLLVAIFLLLAGGTASAKDGYRIKVKFTDAKDTTLYLVHYFAKPLPTIYKADSVRLDKNGEGTLKTDKKMLSGLYMLLLSDMKTIYEFILTQKNGQMIDVELTAYRQKIVQDNSDTFLVHYPAAYEVAEMPKALKGKNDKSVNCNLIHCNFKQIL